MPTVSFLRLRNALRPPARTHRGAPELNVIRYLITGSLAATCLVGSTAATQARAAPGSGVSTFTAKLVESGTYDKTSGIAYDRDYEGKSLVGYDLVSYSPSGIFVDVTTKGGFAYLKALKPTAHGLKGTIAGGAGPFTGASGTFTSVPVAKGQNAYTSRYKGVRATH